MIIKTLQGIFVGFKIPLMELHIGQEIKKKLKEKDVKAAHLAKLINTTPQNLNDIFNRPSIDTFQLWSISKALEFDFFSLFSIELNTERLTFMTNALLDECKKEKQVVEDKYKLQTENAQNQQKYIRMLEEKLEALTNQHKEKKD